MLPDVSKVQCSTAQHSKAQHSAAQQSTAQHSAAQHSTAQHSAAQHSTAQRSAAQHSTAQHSSAQHSSAQHRISILCMILGTRATCIYIYIILYTLNIYIQVARVPRIIHKTTNAVLSLAVLC